MFILQDMTAVVLPYALSVSVKQLVTPKSFVIISQRYLLCRKWKIWPDSGTKQKVVLSPNEYGSSSFDDEYLQQISVFSDLAVLSG